MSLKKLLLSTVLLGSAFFVDASAQAEEIITLKMADQFPVSHIASKLNSQAFKAAIEKASNGKVIIRHFPAQQIAKGPGMLDAVRSGLTDIAVVGIVYTPQKMPLTSVLELPGLFSSAAKAQKAFTRLNDEILFEAEYKPLGIRPLWMMVSPPYQFVMKRKEPITDLSQIKGLKMRAAGGTGAMILKAVGATPVKVAPGDFYVALSRGTIDGAAYTPLGIPGYKLYEVTKSVTRNANLGAVTFGIFINEKKWRKLPEDVQKLLLRVGAKIGAGGAARLDGAVAKTYGKLTAAGMNVYDMQEPALGQLKTALQTVEQNWLKQLQDRGVDGAPVLAKFKAYLNE